MEPLFYRRREKRRIDSMIEIKIFGRVVFIILTIQQSRNMRCQERRTYEMQKQKSSHAFELMF